MESRVKLFGHAVHPMLIPFPIALFTTAAVFDVIFLATHDSTWALASLYLIVGGLLGGALAAIFGLVDFFAIPRGTRAKRIGAMHGIGNVVMVGFFLLSLVTRLADPAHPVLLAQAFAWLGAGLGVITGWLGGELVGRLAVGVDEGANLNAPSSLERPARG